MVAAPTGSAADSARHPGRGRRGFAPAWTCWPLVPMSMPAGSGVVGHDFGGMLAAVEAADEDRLTALVIVAATPRWADWFLLVLGHRRGPDRLPARDPPARPDRVHRAGGAGRGAAPVRAVRLLHRRDERPRVQGVRAGRHRAPAVRLRPRHAAARRSSARTVGPSWSGRSACARRPCRSASRPGPSSGRSPRPAPAMLPSATAPPSESHMVSGAIDVTRPGRRPRPSRRSC